MAQPPTRDDCSTFPMEQSLFFHCHVKFPQWYPPVAWQWLWNTWPPNSAMTYSKRLIFTVVLRHFQGVDMLNYLATCPRGHSEMLPTRSVPGRYGCSYGCSLRVLGESLKTSASKPAPLGHPAMVQWWCKRCFCGGMLMHSFKSHRHENSMGVS